MNEERMQILRMLQEGKINVDEAARLIEAMDAPAPAIVSRAQVTPVQPKPPVAPIAVENQPTPIARPLSDLWPLRFTLFSNLEGAQLDGANFDGARIWCSNLEGADLRNADVSDGWIVASNLESANFAGANLRGAKILGVNLDGADFRGADLQDATLIAANFDRADFRGANLRGKSFVGVNMDGHKYRPQNADVKVDVVLEA